VRILLDTHVFFWWVKGNPRLSPVAARTIEDRANEILVSAVTAWELAIKSQLGKWAEARVVVEKLEQTILANGFLALSVTIEHARLAGFLLGSHRDPFDRLLAAQAQIEKAPLITADQAFRALGAETIW
jgi:PIN domain nuclease of toxin-antitoxin system